MPRGQFCLVGGGAGPHASPLAPALHCWRTSLACDICERLERTFLVRRV